MMKYYLSHETTKKNSYQLSGIDFFKDDRFDERDHHLHERDCDGKASEESQKSEFFTILADESSDVSGVEQLSIGIRFIDVDEERLLKHF